MQVIFNFSYEKLGNVQNSEENKYLFNLKDIESAWMREDDSSSDSSETPIGNDNLTY